MMKNTILCYVLVFVLVINIVLSPEDEPQQEPVVTHGASWDNVCNGNTCTKTLYSGEVNIQDGSGDYKPFSEVVNFKFEPGGILNMSYLQYSVQFEVGITTDKGDSYNWTALTKLFPNAKKHVKISKDPHFFKYGINITDIPLQYQNKIQNVYLKLVGSTNLGWDDVRKEGDDIIIKDKIMLSFSDLLQSHFTIQVNKTHVLIGNITQNIDENGNLLLDPKISLSGGGFCKEDVTYSEYDESTTYYPEGFAAKWNISTIPASSAVTSALYCNYLFAINGAGLDNDVIFWRINSQVWNEIISAASFNGLSLTNQTTSTLSSTTLNKFSCINVTFIIRNDYNKGNTFSSIRVEDPDNLVNPVETVTNNSFYTYYMGRWTTTSNDYWFRTCEYTTTSERPYLNITYSIVDTQSPKYKLAKNTSATFKRYQNVTLSINWTDNTALSQYKFENNFSQSGWANKSYTTSGTSLNATKKYNITLAGGNTACWRAHANDTAHNKNSTPKYCFTVAGTIPSITNCYLNTTSATQNSAVRLNCTVTDIDSDVNKVWAQFKNASNVLKNFSMSLKGGTTDKYQYTYTATAVAGTYNVTHVYANDTTKLKNTTYKGLKFNVTSACDISLSLSSILGDKIFYNVSSIPVRQLGAKYNNNAGNTYYNVSLVATGCTADIYVKANGDLRNGAYTIPLAHEKYWFNLSDKNVPARGNKSLTTTYTDNPIGTNLATSYVYLKFWLNVSGGTSPGSYNNTISFKAVQNGQAP